MAILQCSLFPLKLQSVMSQASTLSLTYTSTSVFVWPNCYYIHPDQVLPILFYPVLPMDLVNTILLPIFIKIKFYISTCNQFIQLDFLCLALTSCFSGSPMLLPMAAFVFSMNEQCSVVYWTMLPLHTGQHTEDDSTPWLWWPGLYYILETIAVSSSCCLHFSKKCK